MPGIVELPMDREPYPQAIHAVWLHDQPCCDSMFESMRRRSRDPEGGLKVLFRAADITLAGADDPKRREVMAKLLRQMDTRDFRRYVAGRLGFY